MTARVRDASLDILKGGACIFMILAHLPFFELMDMPVRMVIHVSGLATGIFFGTAGVTAAMQSKRYTLRSLLLYFSVIFLLGACWNVMVHGNADSFRWIEVLQVIAIGSLGVCLIERNGPAPQWLLLGITLAIIAIKAIVERLWPEFDGGNYLFCDTDYVPHGELLGQHGQLFPGFALFPWLSYFFFGVFCYRLSKPHKLMVALIGTALLIVSVLLGSDPMEKWDTTVAYSIGVCVMTVSFFWLLHDGGAANNFFTQALNKVGTNVFLFFFVHPVGLVVGFVVYQLTGVPYLAWIVAMLVAYGVLTLMTRIKPRPIFSKPITWVIMIGLVLVIPFTTLVLTAPVMGAVTRLVAIVVGILGAINIQYVATMTKVRRN